MLHSEFYEEKKLCYIKKLCEAAMPKKCHLTLNGCEKKLLIQEPSPCIWMHDLQKEAQL
jgi:hypothetical protein